MEDERYETTLIRLLHEDLLQVRESTGRWERETARMVVLGGAMLLTILTLSLLPALGALVLSIPFLILFGICHLGLLDSRIRLGRIQARAIEERLNRSLGGDLFVTHLLEAAHDDAPDAGSILGVSLHNPGSFRSIYSFHVAVISILLFVVTTYRSLQLILVLGAKFPLLIHYPIVLAAWAAIHLVVFVWYWGATYQEKKATQAARAAYGIEEPSVKRQIFRSGRDGASV